MSIKAEFVWCMCLNSSLGEILYNYSTSRSSTACVVSKSNELKYTIISVTTAWFGLFFNTKRPKVTWCVMGFIGVCTRRLTISRCSCRISRSIVANKCHQSWKISMWVNSKIIVWCSKIAFHMKVVRFANTLVRVDAVLCMSSTELG